jgi:hypothetical protein
MARPTASAVAPWASTRSGADSPARMPRASRAARSAAASGCGHARPCGRLGVPVAGRGRPAVRRPARRRRRRVGPPRPADGSRRARCVPTRRRRAGVAQPRDAFGVEAIGGLVQDQYVGIAEERGGEPEPLTHPEREPADAPDGAHLRACRSRQRADRAPPSGLWRGVGDRARRRAGLRRPPVPADPRPGGPAHRLLAATRLGDRRSRGVLVVAAVASWIGATAAAGATDPSRS